METVEVSQDHSTFIMGRARSKSDLPSKICPVCHLSFTWRKKWEDCWDEVKYCSERCRRRKSQAKASSESDCCD